LQVVAEEAPRLSTETDETGASSQTLPDAGDGSEQAEGTFKQRVLYRKSEIVIR